MDLHALVIDADAEERGVVRNALYKQQWKVCEASSVEEAIRIVGKYPLKLVFCDANLSAQHIHSPSGTTLLSEMKRSFGSKVHIVITARQESSTDPFEIFLNGASDFFRKPYREEKVADYSRQVIERLRAAEREVKEGQLSTRLRAVELPPALPELVGESEAIIKVFRRLAEILENIYLDSLGDGSSTARLPSVFITGETGTGKELVAQIIHRRSGQARGQFVPVNCSNLTPDLAESELFGHEPGAFTGASRKRQGLWELADGGTLFLDEITEAPPTVLPKLLRVLQDGMFRRLGSSHLRRTNVQVIAASNRDMRKEVQEGRFRSDLYHRLSLHRLHLPPLRERIEDVPLIVEHFSRRHFRRDIRFAQDALDMLTSYPFPGNVRELENMVCGAARKSPDGVVYAVDLAAYIELREADSGPNQGELKTLSASSGTNELRPFAPLSDEGLDEQVHRFKLQVVKETLAKCGGNVTRAAQALKVSRPSLYRLMRDLEEENEVGCSHPPDLGDNGFSVPVETNCVTAMN